MISLNKTSCCKIKYQTDILIRCKLLSLWKFWNKSSKSSIFLLFFFVLKNKHMEHILHINTHLTDAFLHVCGKKKIRNLSDFSRNWDKRIHVVSSGRPIDIQFLKIFCCVVLMEIRTSQKSLLTEFFFCRKFFFARYAREKQQAYKWINITCFLFYSNTMRTIIL